MEKIEEWKPVVGYEDLYEVSDWGRVKSMPRNTTKGGILKLRPDGGGYLHVDLSKNGEKEPFLVHILVWEAFKYRIPGGKEIDHIDGNPKNNRLINLDAKTHKENMHNPITEERQKEAAKKRSQNPEWLKKNAEHREKMYKDPEWRKNVSEAVKRRAADPEWKKNHAEGCRKRSQNQEWQKNNTEALRRLAQDPNWQKNHAEAMKKRAKPVNQFTLDGTFVKTWESATDAARELGVNQQNISKCCNGKRKKTGGFTWRYVQ